MYASYGVKLKVASIPITLEELLELYKR